MHISAISLLFVTVLFAKFHHIFHRNMERIEFTYEYEKFCFFL